MGTEILRPQDCLIERIRVSPCRRRNYVYYANSNSSSSSSSCNNSNPRYNHDSNPRTNRKSSLRSERTDQRKRQPEHHQPLISKRSTSADDSKIPRNHGSSRGLVMEKVTILRRGESLDSKIKTTETAPFLKKDGMVVAGTDRLGPDPEMVPKQIRIVDLRSPITGKCDMYAGSGFAVSPAPSSLPLPSFSKKKQVPIDDSATRDLRRLLRLDI
ncbi:uncharacterized protein LOC107261088 [Ricinus communis]|uniref:uncharacterized protein LOC107261088 n=1 Tax=Ricinus communis TaxID=3988 RepID=UPI0007723A4B|nr:uncharacterized protein LOC107261088 [Ricinus communis]|eukprot:XP_015573358.1 uncharacterized protein LOC107261088 [Ricinus communis]